MNADQQSTFNIEIDDPDDISQSRRVSEILERRKRAIDAREEAVDMMLTDLEYGQWAGLRYYHSRIVSLILDVWSIFRRMQRNAEEANDTNEQQELDDIGTEFLNDVEIAEITIPPPEETQAASRVPGSSAPEPKTVTICGLGWFLENDAVVSETFRVRTMNPPRDELVVEERPLDIRTLDRALMVCEEFLDEVGIEAQVAQVETEAVGRYADILDSDGEPPISDSLKNGGES